MESVSLPENACYMVHCIRFLLHLRILVGLPDIGKEIQVKAFVHFG